MSRYQQQPKRIVDEPGPLTLSERMLDDLSRLFFLESQAMDREACRAYTRGDWAHGARAELAAQGLEFDSREIADLAFVRFRHRLAHEERNLAPWERRTLPPDPF